ATCTIPIPAAWRGCTDKLYIVAHADVTGPGGVGATAWDNGPCYETTNGNCAKYFTVDRSCFCPLEIDFWPITSTVRERPVAKFQRDAGVADTFLKVSFDTSTTSEYTTSTTVSEDPKFPTRCRRS